MSVYYEEFGNKDAPLIVFLHGGGVNGWMWEKQVAHFAQEYHCLVPDLPEHGQSRGEISFSFMKTAEIMIDLIEERADGKEVTLVGFSLGAQLIIQMLGTKPDIAHKAMINSALVRPMPFMKSITKPMVYLSYPMMKSKSFSKMQAKSLYINEENFEQYYEETCNMPAAALIRVLEENMSFTIPKGFESVTATILVTVGDKEKSVMKKSAEDIAKANGNCQTLVYPNIGHGAPLAIPQQFNESIDHWIKNEKFSDESIS